jgi:cell division protein ZapA
MGCEAQFLVRNRPPLMDTSVPVIFKINGRDFRFTSQPEEETLLRTAEKLVQERIEVHKKRGFRDPQDILTVIALEAIVGSLKADEQARQLQSRIYDKLSQLSHAITPALR